MLIISQVVNQMGKQVSWNASDFVRFMIYVVGESRFSGNDYVS